VLVPALLGWPYSRLDPHVRKSFEVALHAGSALALLIAMRREAVEETRSLDLRSGLHVLLTFVPPAVVGYVLEEPIERRMGSPRSVAAAQIVAGLALAAADGRPASRSREDARAVDFLAIGGAQAAALVPGVSRNGATVTAARLRRFDRPSSMLLSWQAALPVVAGATVLKGARIAQRGMPRGLAAPFAAGTVSAFVTALLAAGLARGVASYRPIAAYRVALGATALALMRRGGRPTPPS
jgi:undecaprenyl-diphosphatase